MWKPRKNKSFNYTSRFSPKNETDTNQEETSKIGDFSSKWRESRGIGAKKAKKGLSLTLLLLVLALVLICMYILDVKSK